MTLLSIPGTSLRSHSTLTRHRARRFNAPLQQINMMMYLTGVVNAIIVYMLIPEYHDRAFFQGYSPMAGLLILVQSMYGVCVGYAYKYADVLIKNLSTSATLALLVGFSAAFFGKPLTFNSVAGSIVIITTSYIYLQHAQQSRG